VFCPNCGTQNDDDGVKCLKCGFNLKGAVAPKFKGTMLMMNSPLSGHRGSATLWRPGSGDATMAEINGKGHYDWCGTAFSRGRRTAHSAGAETTYFSGHFKGVDARNSAADWDHFGLTSADSASSGGSRSVWKSSQSVLAEPCLWVPSPPASQRRRH